MYRFYVTVDGQHMTTEWNRDRIDSVALAEREGVPATESLVESRRQIADAAQAGTWRTDVPSHEEVIAGVRCLVFASGRPARGRVVHAHGGGFRLGCPEAIERYAAALARDAGVEVVCPAYRLAPEHSFPCGLNDMVAVVRAVATRDDLPLVLGGDSAGGGIAAGAVLQLAELPIAALMLHSPWLDLTASGASFQTHAASDPMFSQEAAREAAAVYLQGTPADDPLASPLFGDVSRFPPTLISVGAEEVLLDDAQGLHARLMAQGVAAEIVSVPGMEHTDLVRNPQLAAPAQAMRATLSFLDRVLG